MVMLQQIEILPVRHRGLEYIPDTLSGVVPHCRDKLLSVRDD